MLKFTYKAKINSRVVAKCPKHPRYNPEKEGRNLKGGCSTCFTLFDLFQARVQLEAALHNFERHAAPWYPARKPRAPKATVFPSTIPTIDSMSEHALPRYDA
jgi:hypothetical protein